MGPPAKLEHWQDRGPATYVRPRTMEPMPRFRRLAPMMPTRRPVPAARAALVLATLVLGLLVAACGGAGTPSGSPVPSAGPIETLDAAVAAIRARAPLFDGIAPHNPDLIGQASSWKAEPSADGWRVTFQVGWGDCPSGCIDRHTWTWDVARDGTVTFVGEDGSALTEDQLAAMRAAATTAGVGGRVTGGPTCPVERPGDPACAPRLVAGAVLVVRGADNAEVARFTTDASGFYRIALAPGAYTLEVGPVKGFMSGPGPQAFTVQDGATTPLDLAYDTGIR
jgi:hypothetical protein